MSKKILFDKCVEEAKELAKPYMVNYGVDDNLTKQEWELALLLFQMETR